MTCLSHSEGLLFFWRHKPRTSSTHWSTPTPLLSGAAEICCGHGRFPLCCTFCAATLPYHSHGVWFQEGSGFVLRVSPVSGRWRRALSSAPCSAGPPACCAAAAAAAWRSAGGDQTQRQPLTAPGHHLVEKHPREKSQNGELGKKEKAIIGLQQWFCSFALFALSCCFCCRHHDHDVDTRAATKKIFVDV